MILKMKFFLSFLLILFFLLGGCSSSEEGSTDNANAESVKNLGAELETSVTQLQGNDDQIQKNIESLESSVSDLSAQVASLQSLFLQNEDGSAGFATPTPIPIVDFSDFGFTLPFPATVEPIVTGLAGGDASEKSGSLLASSGGVSLLLIWQTLDPPLTPQESVVGGFDILRATTGADFQVLGAGSDALQVDGQVASYGSFAAVDATGETEAVGVIGGWVCEGSGSSYAMVLTGASLEPVQASFFYFADAFKCAKP
tara:strand:+ start:2061 stop:2828 length:768 start_codon:yes stop_codon:yes gene_type:complete